MIGKINNIGTFGFKVIHWEYIKSPESVTNIDNYYNPKVVVKPNTNIINGILLRFVVRFYKGDKVTLDFIGEQVFVVENVSVFDHSDAMKIVQIGFDNCNQEYNELYRKETGLSGTKLIHTVKPAEGDLILQLIRS